MMKRTQVIQRLIDKYHAKSYLEIGLDNPDANYEHIICGSKECCDPYDRNIGTGIDEMTPQRKAEIERDILTYKMTSDEMFAGMPPERKYDLVFIDGLHLEMQVGRDIVNSLRHLNPGGHVVVHDCLPALREWQEETRTTVCWTGSVWKALPKLAEQGVSYYVVDTDLGCGVVTFGGDPWKLEYPEPSGLDWDDVFSDAITRNGTMHVITVDEFIRITRP